ncbi:hypothetical protein BGZ65_000786, partial [Modicella reniformis]
MAPLLAEPASDSDSDIDWLKARFGPYSVDNPPPQPMEISVRAGDFHAVVFILAMRRRSRLAAVVATTTTTLTAAASPWALHNIDQQGPGLHTPRQYPSRTSSNNNSTNNIHRKPLPDNSGHPFSLMATSATAAYRQQALSQDYPMSAEYALYARPGQS